MQLVIRRTKDTVIMLLENNASLRDSDDKLLAEVWKMEIEARGHKLEDKSAMALMSWIYNGKLSKPESIRRCRQKAQEVYPHLRGRVYMERHLKEVDVIEDLNNF